MDQDEISAKLLRQFERQWKIYCRHFKRCRDAFSGSSVHGLRVSTRRLRSTCELLSVSADPEEIKQLERGVKRAFRTVAPLRDHEILRRQLKGLRGQYHGIVTLQRAAREQARKLEKRARKKLGRIQLSKVADVAKRLRKKARKRQTQSPPTTHHDLFLSQVREAYEEAFRCLELVDPTDTTSIHRTRVAFKRYRYMTEPLSDVVGLSEETLERMHDYQTRMGLIQDVEVLIGFLNQPGPAASDAQTLQRIKGDVLRHRADLIEDYMARRYEFLQFGPNESIETGS